MIRAIAQPAHNAFGVEETAARRTDVDDAEVGGCGGTRMDEARALNALRDLGVYLCRASADGVIIHDGRCYVMLCPDGHPLAARLRGRVFDGITAVEKFIRGDCTLLRTQRRRAAVQQAADDIEANAPGVLTIELPTLTVTDLVFPDGTRITIKTDASGEPAVEIPSGVYTRAELQPGRWAIISQRGNVSKHGKGLPAETSRLEDGQPVQTGLRLAQSCEDWDVPADSRLDDDGDRVPSRTVNVSGQPVPAARLRRIGWLDQRGRVWLKIPPGGEFDGGSLTPLLIDPGERDGC